MQKNKPIGIFDSGVGGTSIWKAIHQQLPFEDTVFLADSKNAPYGDKSSEEITQLSIKNTEKLIEIGCKIIVVACNTATTNAIATLRAKYDIPFIGIEPAIKPAALGSKTKSIGILATKGTLSSALFHATSQEVTKDVAVIEIIGEGLVPLIEAGKLEHPETISLLRKHLLPMISAKIDYLVLGCSHYPYLIPQIKRLLPSTVTIIDSGLAVAKQTEAILKTHNLLTENVTNPNLTFFTNAQTATLQFLLAEYAPTISIGKKDF